MNVDLNRKIMKAEESRKMHLKYQKKQKQTNKNLSNWNSISGLDFRKKISKIDGEKTYAQTGKSKKMNFNLEAEACHF